MDSKSFLPIKPKAHLRTLSVIEINVNVAFRELFDNDIKQHGIILLQEPTDDKYLEHAAKINAGKEQALDFDDPEFVRNIYKAVRLKKITVNKMVTALLLQKALIQFKGEPSQKTRNLKRFAFDEKGPYSPSTISYAKPADLKDFDRRLETLPKEERSYFTVNFSRRQEVLFLYESLRRGYFPRKDFLTEALKKYIEKLNISQIERNKWVAQIDVLDWKDNTTTIKLIELLEAHNPDLVDFLLGNYDWKIFSNEQDQMLEYQNIWFLISLFGLGDGIPSLIISPDYDLKKSNSPLFSFVIPSISAFNELQSAMHGEDATYPFFSAGQINNTQLRELDEHPAKYQRKLQHRPVELVHPDLAPTSKTHGVIPFDFMLMWHDLFHCWRNGCYSKKPLVRHLKNLLEKKGYYLSRGIYKLADLDMGGKVVREADSPDKKELLLFCLIVTTLIRATHVRTKEDPEAEVFWTNTHEYDTNLLILIDIVRNQAFWVQQLEAKPEDFFNYNYGNSSPDNFHETYHKIKLLMECFPNRSDNFYIVAFRLNCLDQNSRSKLALLNACERIGWDKIVRWNRNSGLFILGANGVKRIEQLSPQDLENKLKGKLHEYIDQRELKNFEIKNNVLLNIQTFIQQQINRLQSKNREEGLQEKINLYSKLLERSRMPTINLEKLITECANVSAQGRPTTTHSVIRFFSLGFASNDPTSWTAWKACVETMKPLGYQKFHLLTQSIELRERNKEQKARTIQQQFSRMGHSND